MFKKLCVKSIKLINIQPMIVQLFHLSRNVYMNEPMFWTLFKSQIIIHTRKLTILVGEIIQISIGRVIIMLKLHNHPFKHIIIFKILKDVHLLMFPLLEEILRKYCMYSLKTRVNQHSKCLNYGRFERHSCKNHICL